MKKALLFTIAAAALLSFTVIEYQVKKSTCEATQYQGIYLYMKSTPVSDYTILGTVKKTGIVWSGKPNEMMNILTRRAKNDFPETEGLIFDDTNMEHATCIKFKQ